LHAFIPRDPVYILATLGIIVLRSYIRVKRKNQIFFIHTSPSDTFGYIKSEIAIAMGGEDVISPKNMRLYIDVAAPASSSSITTATKKEDDGGEQQVNIGGSSNQKSMSPKGPIPDTALLSDHKVMNDAIMFVTFANDGVADSWEEIDIVKP
jgi:hypothetical protein